MHTMRIVGLLLAGFFLWANRGNADPGSVVTSTGTEAKPKGELSLYEKDPLKSSVTRSGCNAPGQKTGTFPRKRIVSGGIERQYNLFVPSGYAPGKPTPLVFNFHGFTSDPETQDWLSDMPRLAEEAGFILATPKGWGQEGVLGWNAGACCGQAASENVDDVAFTSDMIDQISAEYCVDPSRIYVQRSLHELPSGLRAIGPNSGYSACRRGHDGGTLPPIPAGTDHFLQWDRRPARMV